MADDEPRNTKPLDELLPVRRVYSAVGDVLTRLRFAVDFVFDGEEFTLTEDTENRRLTITPSNKNNITDNDASFGDPFPVLSRVIHFTTANATPVVAADPSTVDAFQVAQDQAADFVGSILGKKQGSADIYSADIRGRISNNLPVIATLSGDAVTNVDATGALAAASVAITTDGAGAFVITTTGVAATNIDWKLAFTVFPIGVLP